MPYSNDGKLSLYVFLPSQSSNLAAFYQELSAENWENWLNSFRNRPGSIQLPRFKMNYDLTLNHTLKLLGMEVAFDSKADLSGIADDLAISEVKHKTEVEVNEEGTSAMPPQQPFYMDVNRPFFCAIQDNQTGTVLFMGSIVDPQEEGLGTRD